MTDPCLPLNCPKCPRPLAYITTTGNGTHVYECVEHGRWQILPDGKLRPQPERVH